MEEQTDSTFIRNVSIVMVVLIIFTISIVFIARDVGFKEDQGNNPASVALAKERIKPVAGAYTGENGAAAMQEAAATVAPEQTVAFDGSLDAEMIYTSVCSICHATGTAGAPRPGTDAMAQRTEKGMDAMMQVALNGLNATPARGGRSDLSDEQIQAVVEFMTQ